MALQARFVSLPHAPARSSSRRRATFRIGYSDRLSLLESELNKLGAKSIVIQAQFEAKDIRNDGWPRSSARPKGPAVILSFESKHGPLSYPCDSYDAWEDNLYAIALALEALRAVDRYGVTTRAEQYKGWAQLPPPKPSSSTFSTSIEASAWMADVAGVVDGRPLCGEGLEFAYRVAAKRLHPDVSGGSTEQFQRLQDAVRILRAANR